MDRFRYPLKIAPYPDLPPVPSPVYRALAVPCLIFTFVIGLFGNIVFVIVVKRTRSLHTSTFTYLISLALSDVLLLLSAVPDAISFSFIGPQWLTGQAGCSTVVFLNFCSMNLSGASIVAFTIDRYIGICRPLLAVRVCTASYARKIIGYIWIFTSIYSIPWFFLVQVKPHSKWTDYKICDQKLPRHRYMFIYLIDLVLFYLAPLVVSAVVYSQMGWTLYVSVRAKQRAIRERKESEGDRGSIDTVCVFPQQASSARHLREQDELGRWSAVMEKRIKVFRMLIVIVIYFALSWLPYRMLLLYNCFAEKPFLNIWFVFAFKLLIYVNSAMNPLLYNYMSKRFKRAFYVYLTCSREEQI